VGRTAATEQRSLLARRGPAVAVAVGAILAYGALVFGGVLDPAVRAVVDNAGSVLAALVAAGLALLTARAHAMRRLRASWALLGAGLLVRGLTDGFGAWAELARGVPPITPSPADVGYLAMVPLVFAGVLLRPPLQPRRVGRLALLIDSWLATMALMAVAWVLVLGPMYERPGTDPLAAAIALAYPVGGVAILCCLAMALLREPDRHPASVPLLLGLAVMAAGDAAYGMMVLRDAYATGHPVDVVRFASLAMIGLAAMLERTERPVPASRPLTVVAETTWRFTVPTALLALATIAAWGVALRRGGTQGGVAEAALGLAWLLLLARIYVGFQSAAEDHRRERRLRVGHASAFKREQQRLRQLEAVRDVTLELTRELDLTSLLALITRRSAELVDVPMGVVFLWDDVAGVLVPRAWHGLGSWFGAIRLRRGEGAAGRAIELGRGVIVNEYGSSREAFLPLLTRVQVAAALATPVVSLGRLIGVIVVADDRAGHAFGEADLRLLELFADQAAVAIEHARLVDEAASVEALRELARLKTELLSTVSHELRTPLTLIHGYAELLNARAELLTPEDVAMMADEILLGSRTMIRLVDDLLDFSWRDTVRLQLERTRVELAELLRRHVQAWRGQPGGERLRLAAATRQEAFADPVRLDQIIRHLISNALNHAPDGPVMVRLTGDASWACVEVEDRGPGIPEDELPRIWESFFRGERARNSPNRGSGLGLAVVRQLVELHGGRVEAESQVGEGTTFRVWLPAAPEGQPNGGPDRQNGGPARRTVTPGRERGTSGRPLVPPRPDPPTETVVPVQHDVVHS
jgi:signal transduction histidine kinase